MRSIETLNDREAVALLRACIFQPPSVAEDHPLADEGDTLIDPGWCATEHACVAQLAYKRAGFEVQQWSGAVMYFDRDEPKLSFQMLDHRFLLLNGNQKSVPVFDSAGTFPGVDGLPFSVDAMSLGLHTALVFAPPLGQLLEEIHRSVPEGRLAVYGAFELEMPAVGVESFAIDSPMGQWLDARYGDQERMWAKLVEVTALVLEGRPPGLPVAATQENQEALWDWIAS